MAESLGLKPWASMGNGNRRFLHDDNKKPDNGNRNERSATMLGGVTTRGGRAASNEEERPLEKATSTMGWRR
jgi:hypothetical protein